MRTLSPGDLLAAWECGLAQPPPRRALTLLAFACSDQPADELAQLSIGRRDEQLLALREQIFGPRFDGLATCPACGGRIETSFSGADLRAQSPAPVAGETSFAFAGHHIRFRLPNSLDLATLEPGDTPALGRRRLLERCVLEATRDGAKLAAADLPETVVASIGSRMAQADPQADVQLDLGCAHCGHRWLAPFDIVSFFWIEIHAWATRLLHEVHELASAYGWSEPEILALTPSRRRAYLEIIRS